MEVVLCPRQITRILLCVVALLVGAGVFVQVEKYAFDHDYQWGLLRLFDLDGESNVPAWYSSVALFLCAPLLLLVSAEKGAPYVRHWQILAVVFVLLSLDEAASFHESLSWTLQVALDSHGIFYYAWLIPAILFVLLILMVYRRFLWGLPRETRSRFLVAGAVYVTGAIGLEMVESWYVELHGNQNLPMALTISVEEGLEMLGVVLFIRALLLHLGPGPIVMRVR